MASGAPRPLGRARATQPLASAAAWAGYFEKSCTKIQSFLSFCGE